MRFFNESAIVRVFSAFFAVAIFIGGLHFIRSGTSSYPDYSCSSEKLSAVSIQIPSGATGAQVGNILHKAGVVASSESYFRTAVRDQRALRVAPGTHTIDRHICAQVALDQLLDSKRQAGLIAIVEGAWISEIVPQLIASGFTPSDVTAALKSAKKPEGFQSSEGLLFPALYSFAKGTSALGAIQSMIDRTTSEITSLGFFASKEFSAKDLLTIASLIQAEGNTEDFTKISRVIRNRLKAGMPLQFDSTVHYVKGTRGSVFLSTQSTLINSPYNTYRRYGLPPGPIDNPGVDAMKAALTPANGDWLYFITVAPHDTRYTSSLDEFNVWKALYKANLRKGLFRSSQ